MNRSGVRRSRQVDYRRGLDSPDAVHTVKPTVAERLRQDRAGRFIYTAQMVDGVYESINYGVEFVVNIVYDIQSMHRDFLSHFIRHRWVTLQEMLARWRTNGEKEWFEKCKMKRENEKRRMKTGESTKKKIKNEGLMEKRTWETDQKDLEKKLSTK